MNYEVEKNSEFATYLGMFKDANMLYGLLSSFDKKYAEKEKEIREKYILSQDIQVKGIDFSEEDVNKYNLNKETLKGYFHIVDKNGNKLIDEIFYLGGWGYSDFYSLTKALNENNERYFILQFVVIKKYTKEDKKKYTYLKGDYGFENYYCIIDKTNFSIVWKNDKKSIFGSSPMLYDNIMYHDKTYTYLPTMTELITKDSGCYETIITKNHIILGKTYGNDAPAKIIDKHSGEIVVID